MTHCPMLHVSCSSCRVVGEERPGKILNFGQENTRKYSNFPGSIYPDKFPGNIPNFDVGKFPEKFREFTFLPNGKIPNSHHWSVDKNRGQIVNFGAGFSILGVWGGCSGDIFCGQIWILD